MLAYFAASELVTKPLNILPNMVAVSLILLDLIKVVLLVRCWQLPMVVKVMRLIRKAVLLH
jgi:hypothetical protein